MRIQGAELDRLRIKAIKLAADGSEQAVAWHKANNPSLTPEQLEAFEAGYREGFRKGIDAAILELGEGR